MSNWSAEYRMVHTAISLLSCLSKAKIQSYKVIKSRADVTQSQVGGNGSKFGHHSELTLRCRFMQSITCHNIKSGSAIISHTNQIYIRVLHWDWINDVRHEESCLLPPTDEIIDINWELLIKTDWQINWKTPAVLAMRDLWLESRDPWVECYVTECYIAWHVTTLLAPFGDRR